MISSVDPLLRLDILKEYMAFWIDKYPNCFWSFDNYMHTRYPEIIPGTAAHAKSIATHCFYCGRKFVSSKKEHATIDHWVPQSIGKTDKYVICCFHCNNYKGAIPPDDFVRKVTIAEMRGWSLFGFSGKRLKHVFEQVHAVINDTLMSRGPRVYYIKK